MKTHIVLYAAVLAVCLQPAANGQFICTVVESQSEDIE